MNYSLNTVGGCAGEAANSANQLIGAICQLAAQSKVHAAIPLKTVIERVRMPIELRQAKVFYNDFGQCMGYATWAYLCPEVEQRLLRGGKPDLHDFEWNEGSSLWVMDLLVPDGALKQVLTEMRDRLFCQAPTVTYFRQRNGKRMCKRMSRADRSYFWSQSMGDRDAAFEHDQLV